MLFDAQQKHRRCLLLKAIGRWISRGEASDPEVMLKGELDTVRWHLEIEDDFLPTCRVQFGSGQVASAFGSEILVLDKSLPAAKSHPLTNIKDVYDLPLPGTTDGWYGKVTEFIKFYRANVPDGVKIHLPDTQGPFNTAHLVRGDDIFTELYDNPNEVEYLLDLVTDYTISEIKYLNSLVDYVPGWFYDLGTLWKGTARLCNCSNQMISPEFYSQYVYPRDVRFFNELNGGRIHYCGKSRGVVRRFLSIAGLNGIDYDLNNDDLDELCSLAPANMVLSQKIYAGTPMMERLVSGKWPSKRNLIISWLTISMVG
jgi:hypothetical protein